MQLRAIKTQRIGDSFLADCRNKKLSPKTLRGYIYHINRLIQLSPKFPPKSEIIQRALADISGALNADAYYRTWHALGNYARGKYGIANFMDNVIRPRVPKQIMPTISETELNRLAILLREATPRDKAIIALFIDTAIRNGEACNLKRKDIHEDRIIVHGKTGYRIAPISEVTRDLLLSLPAMTDGYVFYGTGKYRNKPLASTGFYKIVRKYLKMVGYQGKQFGPQTLRRSFGRFWLKEVKDIRSLQLILGHESIETTAKYYAPYLAEDIIELHQEYTPGKVFEDVSLKRLQEWAIKPAEKAGALVP